MLSLLQKILPWHVRRYWRHASRLYALRKPPFEGVYQGFEEVGSEGSWDSKVWLEESLRSTRAARARLTSGTGAGLADTRALLPLLLAGFASAPGPKGEAGEPLRILDFGGGTGQDYAHLKASASLDHPIEYLVVDSPACCEAGAALWVDDAAITFGSRLPDSTQRFDVVLAASSLFYAEDFQALLRAFTRYRPALMLFTKTPVREGASFVRAQTNMEEGRRIPHWVIGIEDLDATLRREGYRRVYGTYDEHVYNVDNYTKEFRVDRTAQFVFARVTEPARES